MSGARRWTETKCRSMPDACGHTSGIACPSRMRRQAKATNRGDNIPNPAHARRTRTPRAGASHIHSRTRKRGDPSHRGGNTRPNPDARTGRSHPGRGPASRQPWIRLQWPRPREQTSSWSTPFVKRWGCSLGRIEPGMNPGGDEFFRFDGGYRDRSDLGPRASEADRPYLDPAHHCLSAWVHSTATNILTCPSKG